MSFVNGVIPTRQTESVVSGWHQGKRVAGFTAAAAFVLRESWIGVGVCRSCDGASDGPLAGLREKVESTDGRAERLAQG